MDSVRKHYDLLVEEGNDPVLDPPELRAYMDKWDGDALTDELRLTGNEDVLEIGVGSGRIAVKILPMCRSFCGIDLSPKTIERAQFHLSAVGSNFSLVCGDFLDWDSERRFDRIYSSFTFMHIENKDAAVSKAASLLKTGGRFVLSADKSTAEELVCGTRTLKIYPDTPEAIENALTKSGLRLICVRETEFARIYTAEKI